MNSISILGCGWLGKPLAVSFLEDGFSVKGSTTSEEKIDILEDLEIDDCFEINEQPSSMYELSLTDISNAICISVTQDCEKGKYKYFQIYTPPSRQQIAIEPVTCPPDAMNTGVGLIKLEKQAQVQMKFGMRVTGV